MSLADDVDDMALEAVYEELEEMDPRWVAYLSSMWMRLCCWYE